MDLAGRLRNLGLGQYEANFRDNEIDADMLPRLTGGDLKDIRVSALGDRLRLADAITALAGVKPPVTIAVSSSKACAPGSSPSLSRAPPDHGDVLRSGRLDEPRREFPPGRKITAKIVELYAVNGEPGKALDYWSTTDATVGRARERLNAIAASPASIAKLTVAAGLLDDLARQRGLRHLAS
jgi:hypothetical protein